MNTVAAFQPEAFQPDAFQSEITQAGGVGIGGGRRKKERPYMEPEEQISLQRSYEDMIRLAPPKLTSDIIGAVDPYMIPRDEAEYNRRRSAKPLVDFIPGSERIDFTNLFNNSIARSRLEKVIEKARKQQQEEEEFLLLMLLTQA
jgi:hypothetical protein